MEEMKRHLETSLALMKTDYVDLYQFHCSNQCYAPGDGTGMYETMEDFKRQAVFEDEIGRYSYNIDIHSPTNDKAGYETFIKDHTSLRYKAGESYGIPYRALTVKGIDNLLTAGRCVCTDRYMQSSIRVMPGCYITGQAAGIGAAVVCDARGTNVHEADVHEVQKRLSAMGAFLPNFKD